MMTIPSFSAYDAKSVRLLSSLLFAVTRKVEALATAPLSDEEKVDLTRRVADKLMRVFDSGERNRDALERAALEGFSKRDRGRSDDGLAAAEAP